MARIVDFFDGAESETTPTVGNIVASALVKYPDDATYEASEQNAPATGNIYYNTTDDTIRFYNGTVWQELIDEMTIQAVANKVIDADVNTITNIDNNEIKTLAGIDVTKLHDGSVDNTEFGHLGGVTSPIQTQIDSKQNTSEKNQPLGYAGLDVDGRISESALPITALVYKGNWNASTNDPSISDGVGTSGDFYRTSVAGTQDLGSGSQTFAVGDWVTYNGSIWERSDFSGAGVLNDLDDVDAPTPADGEVLTYNSSSGNWEPGASGAGTVVQQNVAFIGKGSVSWDSTAGGPISSETTASQNNDTDDFLLPTNLKTGYTFTAPQNRQLTAVRFKIVDRGSANGDGNIQAFVYETSGGLPTGAPVATSTTLGTSFFTSNTGVVQTVTLLMGGAFQLVQGTEYAVVVESTDTGDLELRRDNVNSPDSTNVQEDSPDSETFSATATQETFWYQVVGAIQRGEIVLDEDSFLSVPPLSNDRHTIAAQSIQVGDGEAAYVTIDRNAALPTNLTVTVDNITDITPDDDIIVFARVDGTDLYMGLHDPQKIKDGETLALQEYGQGGSGTGSLIPNYVINKDAEADVSNHTPYADGASSIPVDGIGGSPTSTITRSTASTHLLRGEAVFLLDNGTGNKQGEGANIGLAPIDPVDKNTRMQVSFEYRTPVPGSNFMQDGDYKAFVYDVDNATLIGAVENDDNGDILREIGDGRTFTGYFTSTTSLNYRLLIHTTTADTQARSIAYDTAVLTKATSEPIVAITQAGSTSIPNNAFTTVVFTGAIQDSRNIYNPANGEFTIPEDGYYEVIGKLGYNGSTVGVRSAAIYKNGGRIRTGITQPANISPFAGTGYVSAVDLYQAGDIVTIRGFQTSGGNLGILNTTDSTYASVRKVSNGATASSPSAAKNKIQTKLLTANVTTDGTVTDLTFNNLVVGKWYEVTGTIIIRLDNSVSDNSATLNAVHDGNNIDFIGFAIAESVDASIDQVGLGVSFKFQATQSSISFVGSSLSAGGVVLGNNSREQTYLQIEERNDDPILTTDFT